MSQYRNEELFEMLMLYSFCNRNANETAWEFQHTLPNFWQLFQRFISNSRHPFGRFISRLVQSYERCNLFVCSFILSTFNFRTCKDQTHYTLISDILYKKNHLKMLKCKWKICREYYNWFNISLWMSYADEYMLLRNQFMLFETFLK